MFRLRRNEIGIQVAVRLLRPPDQVDDRIGTRLQLWICLDGQRVRHRLQPFRQVAVLKYTPVIRSFLISRCNAEVFNHMALSDSGHLIVKHPFLIRKHRVNYHILYPRKERVVYLYLFQINETCLLFYHSQKTS